MSSLNFTNIEQTYNAHPNRNSLPSNLINDAKNLWRFAEFTIAGTNTLVRVFFGKPQTKNGHVLSGTNQGNHAHNPETVTATPHLVGNHDPNYQSLAGVAC